MKFIVSSTALSSHLQAISRVINSKNALPILDCFLFELEDGTLSVTVSDSETTMVTTVEVNESDTNGRFAVVAKTLLDALKEIPEQPLTFYVNTDNYEITVQYQNGKYSLMDRMLTNFRSRLCWAKMQSAWRWKQVYCWVASTVRYSQLPTTNSVR